MRIPFSKIQNAGFVVACVLALLAGAWLRLYLLSDQIFIDDEWHGFYYAIGKSPGWLLTHFSIPGATCIPLNFYTWILGATVGWSEGMLRLPSLTAGILCILVGPLLARSIIGERRSAIFALLLAISPMLIFYSRIARPYSAVTLLSLAAILLAACWKKSGRILHAVLFVIVSALAIYFHLFAVVTVAAPILIAFIFAFKNRKATVDPSAVQPSLRSWIIVTASIAGISAALVLPALIQSLRSTFFSVALTGTFKLASIPNVLMLISGTAQPVLGLFFWLLVIVGAVESCRKNPWFGWMLVCLYPLHIAALMLSRPDSAQSAIVIARYCITLVPVSLLLVACGILFILERVAARVALRPSLQWGIAVSCVAILALFGPLAQTYIAPNSFTNHGVYQHNYKQIDWRNSFYSDLTPPSFRLNTVINFQEVSPFYSMLAEHPKTLRIVEYPMLVGDHFNPLYYYQHFHQQAVFVGYTTNINLPGRLAAGNVFGNNYIDEILTLIRDSSQLKFRNLVAMDDLKRMRAQGIDYVILHKQFEAELWRAAASTPELSRLLSLYKMELGSPAYEDTRLVAFQLIKKVP